MSPDLIFWYELALKMALTAIIVVVVSVTVERSGPFIGALIAALGYTVLAQRHGLLLSLGIAMAIWFVGAAALRLYDWTPLTAFLLNVAVFGATVPLSWRYRTSGPTPKFLRTAYDIPLRAITAAIVVAIVTTASYSIGSFVSGVFAVFPIVMASSIVILHPRVGGKATASMFAHSQIALIGLWLGFLALHYLVAPVGVWPALVLALGVCIGWSFALLLFRARKRPA